MRLALHLARREICYHSKGKKHKQKLPPITLRDASLRCWACWKQRAHLAVIPPSEPFIKAITSSKNHSKSIHLHFYSLQFCVSRKWVSLQCLVSNHYKPSFFLAGNHSRLVQKIFVQENFVSKALILKKIIFQSELTLLCQTKKVRTGQKGERKVLFPWIFIPFVFAGAIEMLNKH